MTKAKITILTISGILLIAFAAYLADYAINRDHVPRGAQVQGITIGGMKHSEAVQLLSTSLDGIETRPISIHAGQMDSSFVPSEAGLSPDWEETVSSAGMNSPNPWKRLKGLFTSYDVDIINSIDQPALDAEAQRVATDLQRKPSNAGLIIDAGHVVTHDAIDGQSIKSDELIDAMSSSYSPITINADITPPAVRTVDSALPQAERAVSAPVIAHGRGTDGVLPPARMGEVLTFAAENDRLVPKLDIDKTRGILAETLADTERERRNATVDLAHNVTPHTDGVSIIWDQTLNGIQERIIGDQPREWDVAYHDDPASFTTEQAEAATFDDVVGEFTTGGFEAASGVNIRRVASVVDGAFIAPGETFSLNGYTGPRGTAEGYVESGIILNGHADKAVGGGISQFATTLYNAAYFAGLEDVTHTPHSYYISRYPAGREATVFEGAIDLQFRNNTEHPIIITTQADESDVTVKLMGVKTVNVESINGGRWAETQPQPITVTTNCSASRGAPGFSTSDTRIIRDLSGNELSRETTTTVYDPQPIVRCG